jgi:hypothetical protein
MFVDNQINLMLLLHLLMMPVLLVTMMLLRATSIGWRR